jgi:hypothetical protein
VRQSGYALIGDLAMSCFEVLRPHLPQVMPELIAQLDPSPKVEFVSASNNAAWSAGEIALHYGSGSNCMRAFGYQFNHTLLQTLTSINGFPN